MTLREIGKVVIMQYSKSAIDLVLEVRRNAPESYRVDIKFSNPDLYETLWSMSRTLKSSTLKSAVDRLLELIHEEAS